jgi:DNA helicase-2/ATP-dependent DNA helicase PcrA
MTRAMRMLSLTHARQRNVFGSRAYGLPSRFLAEIPPDLVDRESQVQGGWAGAAAAGRAAAAGGIRPRASASWASMREQSQAPAAGGDFRVGASATTSCTPRSARAS